MASAGEFIILTVVLVILVCCLTGFDFLDGRKRVNLFMLLELGRMVFQMQLKGDSTRLNCGEACSKHGAQREPAQETLRSTFLKRGTFIVLISKYGMFIQWIYFSLARDAYNAVSTRARCCQGLYFQ